MTTPRDYAIEALLAELVGIEGAMRDATDRLTRALALGPAAETSDAQRDALLAVLAAEEIYSADDFARYVAFAQAEARLSPALGTEAETPDGTQTMQLGDNGKPYDLISPEAAEALALIYNDHRAAEHAEFPYSLCVPNCWAAILAAMRETGR